MRMPMIHTWKSTGNPEGVRALMGWGGVIVRDNGVDVLDMLRAYYARAASESCGQCVPCRIGLKHIAAILDRLCSGTDGANADGANANGIDADVTHANGSGADVTKEVERLARLAELVRDSARCDLGQTSPQPLLDVLAQAPELFAPRKTKAGSYTALVTAPCVSACPSHVDVPGYLESIRFRRFAEGLRKVRLDCALPGVIGRVCVRPCEAACKRGKVDAPLAIRSLKRFLADEDSRVHPHLKPGKAAVGAQKVAVAGAGPAGLACASRLLEAGVSVTIFELRAAPGGMSRYGIPDYRLPPPVIDRDVEAVLAAGGCEIRYGMEVGRDITIAELEEQGFDAVFLGVGAPESAKMRCEGENACYEGFTSGIHYLSEAAQGRWAVSGRRAVIIGGGNVAMDCVRTAVRQGMDEVRLLYRRTREEMPADAGEIAEALEEGVLFTYLAAPLRILAEDNRVTGLLCRKMALGEPDASGRRKPVPVEGSEFVLPCDVIIPAIGQSVAADVVLRGEKGGFTHWNSLAADRVTGQVADRPGLFGGGDCVTGPHTLIAALGAGKRAADHIIRCLRDGGERRNGMRPATLSDDERLKALITCLGVLDPAEAAPWKGFTRQLELETLPPAERIHSFREVETGPETFAAVQEAERCLRCVRVVLAAF